MSKIEIQIPEGKEVDWQESAKQEKIIFKEKQLTYNDICKKLFRSGGYCINSAGGITYGNFKGCEYQSNNATLEHQLECILAKNKLANVARYLNGDWDNYNHSSKFIIWIEANTDELTITKSGLFTERATVIFKSKELAQKAIEILGREEVKLALQPLY